MAFDPLTCPVYSKTQNVTFSEPKPEQKERTGPPKTHSFSQVRAHINRVNEHPYTTLHIQMISQSFGLSLCLHRVCVCVGVWVCVSIVLYSIQMF